jgi:hypothetical protein
MVPYTKIIVQIITLALVLFAHNNFAACQCFNSYYLKSIFNSHQNIECFISTEKAILTDGRNNAISSLYGCSLNTKDSNIHLQFYDLYGQENDICIEEILNACGMLNAGIHPNY